MTDPLAPLHGLGPFRAETFGSLCHVVAAKGTPIAELVRTDALDLTICQAIAHALNRAMEPQPDHAAVFGALRAATNEGLELLRTDPLNAGLMIPDAVNWGSLRCESVEYWHRDDGDHGYRVTLEEADPEAVHLQEWMRQHLERAGFRAVEVRTEW